MNLHHALKLMILLIIIKSFILPAFAHDSRHHKLVLVSSVYSKIEPLSPGMFRKLFLNIPVASNNQQLIPLINNSDPLLYEIFLQKIVYMSERHYDRLLISRTFRTGRSRPRKFTDKSLLIKALISKSGSVSVMSDTTANNEKEIRVIQILWEDQH